MTERNEHVEEISERLDVGPDQIFNTTISHLEGLRAELDAIIGVVKDARDHLKEVKDHFVHVNAWALESKRNIASQLEGHREQLAIMRNGKHETPTPRMLDDQDLAEARAKVKAAK